MRYARLMVLLCVLVLGFGFSAQAGEWVGVLTGISCAEKAEVCPAADRGTEEIVLPTEDNTALHLEEQDESYLLNQYGHRERIFGELEDEMGRKTVDVESLQHLAVVAK